MVALNTVERGALIGIGGFGQVYRVNNSPVAGETRALVYKEPRPDLDASKRLAVLRGMADAVAFRDALIKSDRARLDEISVWPLAMATDSGQPAGCLLPLIPPNFFTDFKGASGLRDERGIVNLGALSWDDLSRDNIGLEASGFDDDVLRLLVLNKLADALAFLHTLGRVYGDLNPNNVAICLTPPQVLLMDCDATGFVGDARRGERQGHFPSWTPPEHDVDAGGDSSLNQDFSSDAYKLALAYVKSMTPGPGATQRVAVPQQRPDVFDDNLLRALSSALEADPRRRVSTETIAESGREAAAPFTQPPRLTSSALTRSRVVRGQDIGVSWQLEGPAITSLSLISPDAVSTSMPIGVSRSTLRVALSGPVSIRVDTRYSSATFVLGVVECFELPTFSVDRVNLPVVHLPELPLLPQSATTRAIQAIPLPIVTAADSSKLFDELARGMESIGSATSSLISAARRAAPAPDGRGLGDTSMPGFGWRLAQLMERVERHVRQRML